MIRFLTSQRFTASAVVLVVAASLASCDFQRYDHGADAPTASHLEALLTADSKGEAQEAIRAALNKMGVDWAKQEVETGDADTGYVPDEAALEQLAAAHAAFVRGVGPGVTVAESYTRVQRSEEITEEIDEASQSPVSLDRPDVRVSLDDAILYFNAAVRAAEEHPEEAGSALLLLTAHRSTTMEGGVPALTPETVLSPAQQLFFMMWLHRNGPYMVSISDVANLPGSPISDGEALSTEEEGARKGGAVDLSMPGQRTYNVSGCCDGSGKITSITMIYLGSTAYVSAKVVNPSNKQHLAMSSRRLEFGDIFTVSGAGRTNVSGGFQGTLGNELQLSVNNSSYSSEKIHTSCSVPVYAGQQYNRFVVLATQTKNGPGCNNLHVCLLGCKAQFLACLGCDPSDARIEECKAQYRSCDQLCHDQGGSYGGH